MTVKNIKVLQLKETPENRNFFFMPLRRLEKFGLKVSLDNYETVFTSEYYANENNDFDILENLYITFQGVKPITYNGHSLSVSDIIEIDGIKYYCDSIGFKKL